MIGSEKIYRFVAGEGRMEVGEGAGNAAGFVPDDGESSGDAEVDGEGEGLGIGVGQGFSRDVHSCHSAVSVPPSSFQRSWQRLAQWA